MRQLLFLLKKEFRQIFRNKSILAVIFVMPVVQLIVLPLAASYEIKNINLAVVDHDHSSFSRRLIQDVTSSNYFKIQYYGENYNEAYEILEKENADLILEIPQKFEKISFENLKTKFWLPSMQLMAQKPDFQAFIFHKFYKITIKIFLQNFLQKLLNFRKMQV